MARDGDCIQNGSSLPQIRGERHGDNVAKTNLENLQRFTTNCSLYTTQQLSPAHELYGIQSYRSCSAPHLAYRPSTRE